MPTASPEVHVGDVGTIFRCTVTDNDGVVDISTASATTIAFRTESGAVTEKTAEFYTDGTDGIMQYTTIAGDLNEAGVLEYQGKVVTPGGSWKTDVKTERVYPNIF